MLTTKGSIGCGLQISANLNNYMAYLIIIIGFSLLLIGGEASVRGSVSLAKMWGVSPMIIGLTIVGFGTSLPELIVSVNAALADAPGLAVGNVIGSNIANLLLILSASILIFPFSMKRRLVRYDAIAMVIVTLIFSLFCISGQLDQWTGFLFLMLMATYIGLTLWHNNRTKYQVPHSQSNNPAQTASVPRRGIHSAAIIGIGLIALVGGSELLVRGATDLAVKFGVSDEVIGLTIVAVGTSLPELAAAIVASYRGHPDICVGNVLGSNIFNLCGITGATALVTTLPITYAIINFDLLALLSATMFVFVFLVSGFRFSRLLGVGFLCLYIAYIVTQYSGFRSAFT